MNATVPCRSTVTMTATSPLVHLCPHVDEIDNGTVTVMWRTTGQTFELHALADYLRSFKDVRISHEDITDQIRRHLTVFAGIEDVTVSSTWDTAGMEVRCSTSPTPADLQ